MAEKLLALPFLLAIIVLIIVWALRARKRNSSYMSNASAMVTGQNGYRHAQNFATGWISFLEKKDYQQKEFVTVILKKKRYVAGTIQAKYWAQNEDKFFDYNYEQVHDINIYEAEVFVNVADLKNDDEQLALQEKFDALHTEFVSDLPRPLKTTITHTEGSGLYLLDYEGAKVYDFSIGKIQDEGKESFGTITGMFIGYVVEEIPEQVAIEESAGRAQEVALPDGHANGYPRITGKKETQAFGNAIFVRNEIETGQRSFIWSDWEKIRDIRPARADSWTSSFFSFLLAGLFFVLLFTAWKIPVALLLIGFVVLLLWGIFRFIARVLKFALSIFFVGALLSAVIGLFKQPDLLGHKKPKAEASKEVNEKRITRVINNDSLISNFRSWDDYHGHHYEGYLSVSEKNLEDSRNYAAAYGSSQPQDEGAYHNFCGDIVTHDSIGLKYVYEFFDSLKSANQLSPDLFAEAIITCVQDIPYVLITNGPCSADYYPPGFIKSYLQGGGDCEGAVPFGLFSPIEFTASLQGDCDTRTIFAYTVLKHYRYDVIVLSSKFYAHSILGVALQKTPPYRTTRYPTKPVEGISGAKYFLCELTSYGLQPGIISEESNDLSKWKIELK